MKKRKILTPTPEIIDFLGDEFVCLYHPSKTVRASFTNVLGEFGITANKVERFSQDDFEEINTYIKDEKPSIVITEAHIGDQSAIELLETHLKVRPDRRSCAFIVLSEENSLASASLLLDHEVDGYFFSPYNIQEFSSSLTRIYTRKVKESSYLDNLYSAKNSFYSGSYVEAEENFVGLLGHGKDQAQIFAYLGKSMQKQGDQPKAIEYFKEGITHDPKNYWCLNGLVDSYLELKKYNEAYTYVKTILANFPFNPRLVPKISRISVATNQYDDLEELFDICQEMDIQEEGVKKNIAAGMVVGSKYLLANDKKQSAKDILHKALKLCDKNVYIKEQACLIMAEFGEVDKAIQILEEISSDHFSDSEFVNVLLRVYLKAQKYNEILKVGEKSIREKVATPESIEMMLNAAQLAHLKKDQIESIVDQATTLYPDLKSKFHSFIQ